MVELATAIRDAAAAVRLTVELPDGPASLASARRPTPNQSNGDPGGELTAERAASYIAK
jgi:hypothetical protein